MTATADTVLRREPPSPRERWNDLWLAGALLVAAILSAWLGSVAGVYGDEARGLEWGLAYSVALTAPLVLRRRFPMTVLLVVAVVYFVGVSLRIPDLYVGSVTQFIALYTVGAWVNHRRRAVIVRVAVIVGMFVWLMVAAYLDALSPGSDGPSRAGAFSPYAAVMLIQFLVNIAFYAGAYYLGDRAYAAALQRETLNARTAELEREREVTAAQAVALDRVRIARELHDVVAHHVSAMGVQAGAARTVLDKDREAARTALGNVESSARTAIDDLHKLLDTLRSPASEVTDASTVGVDSIDALIAHARVNGLQATMQIVGEPYPIPSTHGVNVYRIAQEALTNARRHGGADATADVRLRYDTDAVELEVTNSGRAVPTPRPGMGLIGMRERAVASGGSVEFGPRARGGFLVRARIPRTAGADR